MSEISKYIEIASSNQPLTKEQAERAFQIITSNGATPSQIAGFLMALKTKGETVDEISAAVLVLRHRMLKLELPKNIHENLIDCCGTGGDGKRTLNISSAVAFVLAASGLNVAKHGNRAVSSKSSGSSDVIQALGVNLDISKQQAEECLLKCGISFLFAPNYHKSFLEVRDVRKDLGVRTIFNILGPLCNPATPLYQLIGVYDKNLTHKIAEVCKNIGLKSAIIVCGEDGLDEISICAKTFASELKPSGEILNYEINPENYGLKLYQEKEILGKDADHNAKQMLNLFKGGQGAYRDAVVLNSAFALKVAGKVASVNDGVKLSQTLLDDRKALEKLRSLVEVSNISF
jgi:anthranilate phosphoribosyltransferase